MRIECASCRTQYDLQSEHEPLAGKPFPCGVCGEPVVVPILPWEEDGPLEPPGVEAEAEVPTDSLKLECPDCNEEYPIHVDDGLAGLKFPCEVCGSAVDVPPLPWTQLEGAPPEDDHLLLLTLPTTGEAPPRAAGVASAGPGVPGGISDLLPDSLFEDVAVSVPESDRPQLRSVPPKLPPVDQGVDGRAPPEAADDDDEPPAPSGGSRLILVLGVLGLLAVLGGYLGGHLGPSGETTEPASSPTEALKGVPPAGEVPAPAREAVELLDSNVDTLGYRDLVASVGALEAGKLDGLGLWGTYRLASRFGHAPSLEVLAGALKKPVEPGRSLAGLALAGAAGLGGDHGGARERLEKVKGDFDPGSARLALVSGDLLIGRKQPGKALREVSEALAKGASTLDLHLMRIRLTQSEDLVEEWTGPLFELGRGVEDLDTAVRIAGALVRLEKTGEAFKVLAPFRTEGQEVPVAPLNREAAFTLFIARNILRGHFDRARALAAGRSLLQPDNAMWARVHAHLVEVLGGDSLGVLSQSIGRSTSKVVRLELLAETLRLQVKKDDLEGAVETLKTLENQGRKGPWYRYGRGIIQEARGKLKAAKRSYQKAFKGRDTAPVAHLAYGRLTTEKGLPTGVLGDLSTNKGVTEATLPFAKALLDDGRWESAVRVLEEAIWQGAITGDPMEGVLALSAAYLTGNQAPRAVELLVLIQEGAPEDPRPIDRLLALAPAHPDLVERSTWEARRRKLTVFNKPPSGDAPETGEPPQKDEEKGAGDESGEGAPEEGK